MTVQLRLSFKKHDKYILYRIELGSPFLEKVVRVGGEYPNKHVTFFRTLVCPSDACHDNKNENIRAALVQQ